jgi:hypothetical protein
MSKGRDELQRDIVNYIVAVLPKFAIIDDD